VTLSSSGLNRYALRRARQAVQCLPFRLAFYRELEQAALSSTQLADRSDWQTLSRIRLSANRTENDLIWLIKLGVLRREVDGQGLTERVRLTPLGRDVLAPWKEAIPLPTACAMVQHWLRRHRLRS